MQLGKERGLSESDIWTRAASHCLSLDLVLAPKSAGLRDPARSLALSRKIVAAAPPQDDD